MGLPDPLLLGMAPAPVAANHPRSPALAAFLALLCPGLGHFYCGSIAPAVVWSLVPHVALLGLMWVGVYNASKLHLWLAAGIGALFLLRLVQVALAWKQARALSRYTLQRTNSVALYFAFFLGTSIFTSLLSGPFRELVVEPFKVPSGSMEPSLSPGDQFFVVKMGPYSKVAAGDVVVYRPPDRADSLSPFVGRVVALGGESVELEERSLILNDVHQHRVPCDPPTLTIDDMNTPRVLECFQEGAHRILQYESGNSRLTGVRTVVPADHFFVLGDNRDNAFDSREFGPVPITNIVGRVAVVWLSFTTAQGLRTERIGLQP